MTDKKGEGGPKIISLEAFRKRKEIEEAKPPSVESDDQPEDVLKTPADHKEGGCVCVFCEIEKEGVQITEVIKKRDELRSTIARGHINPRHFSQWLNDLRTEDLGSLAARIMGLDEQKTQTHPTYAKAVFRVFQEMLKHRIDMFSSQNKE